MFDITQEEDYRELTLEEQYLVNGGDHIENSIEAQAGASVGDTVTDSNGKTSTLTQGDINWAQKVMAERNGSGGNSGADSGSPSYGPSGNSASNEYLNNIKDFENTNKIRTNNSKKSSLDKKYYYVVKAGDILIDIIDEHNKKFNTNLSVEEIARFNKIKDPDYIYVGQKINLPIPSEEPDCLKQEKKQYNTKLWEVTIKGSGWGVYSGFMIGKFGGSIDYSRYDLDFTITETKERFNYKFKSVNTGENEIKIGGGAYIIADIQGKGYFVGEKPSQYKVVKSFIGQSTVIGGGFLWIGINGSKTDTWTVNTATMGMSSKHSLPFCAGIENSVTEVRY